MKKLDIISRWLLYGVTTLSLIICFGHSALYYGMGNYALNNSEDVLKASVLSNINSDEKGVHPIVGSKEVFHREGKCDIGLEIGLTQEEMEGVQSDFKEEYTEKFSKSFMHNFFEMTDLEVYQNNQNIVVKSNYKEKYTLSVNDEKDYLTYIILPINDR